MAKSTKIETEKNQRFTLFANPTNISKLDYIAKAISFNENRDVTRTDLVNDAISEFISRWEKKNGEITKR